MTAEIHEAKGENFEALLPELTRRLELVELPEKVLDMYPIELSGGMKQRMVMVISTLLNPSVLIADEITSALDGLHPEGDRRDPGGVPQQGAREVEDTLSPMTSRPHTRSPKFIWC